jgi:hypothetical protein
MKSAIKLVLLLLLGMSPAVAQSTDEREAKPFHITSRGTAYGVQGEFEGTYRVSDSSIDVYVSKATLYVSDHPPYQGRRRINSFTFGLWNEEATGWKNENRAPPIYVYVVMNPREEHLMFDLRFSLPVESSLDLTKRSLVVEIQEDTLDAPLKGSGYAFVHGCPNMFVQERSTSKHQITACKK